MVAERRSRISMYTGPLTTVERRKIPGYENNGGYVAERKYDGMWCALHVDHGGPGQHRFESRTGLDCDGSDMEGLQGIELGIGSGTILIGELEAASEAATISFKKLGFRRFFLFDVMKYQGDDISRAHYQLRQSVLRRVIWHRIPKIAHNRIVLCENAYEGFLPFYDRIVAEGGEGIVIKSLNKNAKPTRSDGKTPDWIRVKPMRTIDYVVMGPGFTEKGELSAKLGLWDGTKVRFALQAQIPDIELSADNKHLVQEGLVVEMQGREMFTSGAIRHAVFRRWRPDKTPEMCSGESKVEG